MHTRYYFNKYNINILFKTMAQCITSVGLIVKSEEIQCNPLEQSGDAKCISAIK